MHEMHSLLFAALETFSLILSRKRNISRKNREKKVISFSDDVLCGSVSRSAHEATVPSSSAFTVSEYVAWSFFLSARCLEGFGSVPAIRALCPSVQAFSLVTFYQSQS